MKRVLAAVLLIGLVLAGILAFRARKPPAPAVARAAAVAPPVPEPAALVASKTQARPPELRRGAVEIVGLVRDLTGGAVPNATVTVTMASEGSKVGSVATTDAAGEFHAWVDEGEITATATADGYGSATRETLIPGARLELVLTPESVLEGIVVEAGSETPVPGALVTADAQDGEASSRSVSGPDGRFRIRALGPGHYKPEAVTPNRWGTARASVLLGLAESVHDVRIEVHPSFSLRGRVLRGEAGCADATVLVVGRTFLDTRTATSNAEGDVQLEGLFPDTYEVTVTCPDAVERDDGKVPDVVVKDADVAGLVWRFDVGLTLRGTVFDEQGRGVGGARVLARSEDERHGAEAETGTDGTFTVRGLEPGRYELAALRGEVFDDETLAKVSVMHDVEGVRLTLPAGGTIRGSVVDDRGAPVAGVSVQAEASPADVEDTVVGSHGVRGLAVTREDGSFVIADLHPLHYVVRVERHGQLLRRMDAKLPEAPVDVAKGRTTTLRIVVEGEHGSLHGRVVDAQGNPVENVFVEAQRRGGEGEHDDANRKLDHTDFGSLEPVLVDADGRFTIGKLAEGRYAVRAFRRGGGDAIAQDVALGSDVTLTMKDDASIAGVVAGAPDRFTVTATSKEDSHARTESFFRTVGAFTLRDLPPGAYDIGVEATEGIGVATVTLAPGARQEDLRIELRGFGKARGVVLGPDGKPIAHVGIVAMPKMGEPGSTTSFLSDAAGRFEMERVTPGKTRIHFFSEVSRGKGIDVDIVSGSIVDVGTVQLEQRKPDGEEDEE